TPSTFDVSVWEFFWPLLGRSAASRRPTEAWLADLLGEVRTRPVLVAHSLACAPALRYAIDHPDRVGGLVLLAPAFLQAPGSMATRSPAAAWMLRRMSAARLAATLGVDPGPEIDSAAADLHRPGVARRVVAALRAVHAERASARALLDRVSVPVEIVVGAADPLVVPVEHPVTVIPGAGHYPQLTHPDLLAGHLERVPGPR
ncbi:alpha/beta fold hydrolase, partial [Nocardia sp. NPDC004722]